MKSFSAEIILILPIVKCSLSDVIVPHWRSYGGGMSACQSLLRLPALIVPCCVPSQNEPFQLLKDVSIFICTASYFPWKFSESKDWTCIPTSSGWTYIKYYISSVVHESRVSYYINRKHWYVHSSHLRSLEILGSWQPPVPPAPRRIWHLLLAFVGAVLMSTYLYTDACIHIQIKINPLFK